MKKPIKGIGGFKGSLMMVLACILYSPFACGQYVSYNQYSNNFNLTRPLKDKWSGELGLSSTYSGTPTYKNPLYYYSEFNINGGFHNYFNARWRFSFFTTWFLKTEITDFQGASREWRFTPFATYYIHKRNYTLCTIGKFEARYLRQEGQEFTDYYRYRQQLRYLQPFNSKIILQGVWYGIAAEEVIFKLYSSKDNVASLDRNRLTLGIGYSITNNMQIELAYVNEFIPRTVSESCNAISVTFNFNNFVSNFKENLRVIRQDLHLDEE